MVSEKFTVELKAPDIEPYRKSNIGVEFVTTLIAESRVLM